METPVTMNDQLVSAVTTVKTDALAAFGDVLPIALAVAGAVIAVRLGWKFFRSLAK